jgi:hypothetical protein
VTVEDAGPSSIHMRRRLHAAAVVVVVLGELALAAPARAEPAVEPEAPTASATLHLATGLDFAYPMALFAGLSLEGSYRFLTAEVGAQKSPGVHVDEHVGLFATVGAHADVMSSTVGWTVGGGVAFGVRRTSHEPCEGCKESVTNAMGSASIDAVRWNGAGYGLSFRLATTVTQPVAWDEMAFDRAPGRSCGFDLSMGIARRW